MLPANPLDELFTTASTHQLLNTVKQALCLRGFSFSGPTFERSAEMFILHAYTSDHDHAIISVSDYSEIQIILRPSYPPFYSYSRTLPLDSTADHVCAAVLMFADNPTSNMLNLTNATRLS